MYSIMQWPIPDDSSLFRVYGIIAVSRNIQIRVLQQRFLKIVPAVSFVFECQRLEIEN
jgi:hypothetical protein